MRIGLVMGTSLLVCVGCALIQTLTLGVDLLTAVVNAPEGQKACAAFDVLDTQADGRSVSGLLNAALKRTNSSVRFSVEDGDALLRVARAINCEFISCVVVEIKNLSPPEDDASAVQWAQERLDVLAGIVTGCPSPVNLAPDEMVQLVRTVVALKL